MSAVCAAHHLHVLAQVHELILTLPVTVEFRHR